MSVSFAEYERDYYDWKKNKDPNEIAECDPFIEINATDGDAGWQGIFDASAWGQAFILGPSKRGYGWQRYLKFEAEGNAKKQGMTEQQWESAEPTFDKVSLELFLKRFPAGTYKCVAHFIKGYPRYEKAEDELTHCLPDGPVITDPGELPAGSDWTVMWEAVTTQFNQDGPGLGDLLDECDVEDELVKYTVTVEFEEGVEKVMSFDVIPQLEDDEYQLPIQSAVISGDFLECGLEGKVEIGAVVDSGNATFREVEIATSGCPD